MRDKQLTIKSPDELQRALGTAMCQWQAVEGELYVAFHNVLGADQKYTAKLYFDIRSPERKIKIAEDLLRLYMGEDAYSKRAKRIFR